MNDLLKFITCGSVDDGKSTLIGHLLYDAKLIYADQKEALLLDSKVGSRGGAIDYSLLLDGLLAEREQGITIDVAYRYFTTDNRSFICADTPGHEEYTRNMACGASFADLAVILIDATKGVLTQSRRHARICALMGIRHFVFALNKMDLADYSEETFAKITKQIRELQQEINLANVTIIPVSATEGDNVMHHSKNMPWYTGKTLLEHLETVDVSSDEQQENGFYMPVQRVCRPSHEFRGFQGQIEAGSISVGDEITTLPSGETAAVKSIIVAGKPKTTAVNGQPVTIELNREVDVSRGCVLEKNSGITVNNSFNADILAMDDTPLKIGKEYLIQLGTQKIPSLITKINYRIDINTGEKINASELNKNEIASVTINTAEPIVLAKFNDHQTLGELILIDRLTNQTSACAVVRDILASAKAHLKATENMRAALNWQEPKTFVFNPAKDGTTLAAVEEAEYYLIKSGRHTYLYHPKAGEDYEQTLIHLQAAGLIVLLVLDDGAVPIGATAWASIAEKNLTPAQIAEKIMRDSTLSSMITPNNWVI